MLTRQQIDKLYIGYRKMQKGKMKSIPRNCMNYHKVIFHWSYPKNLSDTFIFEVGLSRSKNVVLKKSFLILKAFFIFKIFRFLPLFFS